MKKYTIGPYCRAWIDLLKDLLVEFEEDHKANEEQHRTIMQGIRDDIDKALADPAGTERWQKAMALETDAADEHADQHIAAYEAATGLPF